MVACMDKVTFFQQTLQTLGDREYKRDTPTGKVCDLWFPSVVIETLNYGAWSFASKTVTLQPDHNGHFLLPPDCLRPFKVGLERYRIDGRWVIDEGDTGDTSVELRYISDDIAKTELLPETAPLFIRGTSLLLAARMCVKVTGDANMATQLEQMAYETLAEALHKDALAQYSNDQHPLNDILNLSIIR